MNREEILATIQPLETETKVKSWMFQVENKFYHVSEYGGVYRVLPGTGIWEANKKGKRTSADSIFKISGMNYMKCINEFLNSLGVEVNE